MAYAVDFVLEVIRKISSSEPVLFQRDRSFYVASAEGFGQVTYGLLTKLEKIVDWDKRPPAIAESTDVIKEDRNGNQSFIKGEKQYFQAIAFGSDTNQFTLEDITKAAHQLAELPDDGKIRMIRHGSNYHSHKYGYAADGIDVHVQEARVMDRNRYLELVREEEGKFIQDMERIGESALERHDNYGRLKVPNCVIITPYLIVSLPRKGRLHLHRDEPDSWTEQTHMKSNYSGSTLGSILYHNDVELSRESPFLVNVTINARKLQGQNGEDLEYSGKSLVEKIKEQLSAVTSSMPIAEKFLEKLNGVHNKVCAPEIGQRKNWRRDMQAGAPI